MVDSRHLIACNLSNDGSKKLNNLGILHHNIQSLGNKVMTLNVLFSFWSLKPAILCLSEHWLHRDYLLHINVDQYKLGANFCRTSNRYGGTCIFVSNDLKTRELPFVNNLARESVFEISAIEVVDLKIIVVCIYRSPNSNKEIFFELLEETLNKVKKKGHLLVLCEDWNINLLEENIYQKALQRLLLLNNLQNTVSCPTRVTSNTCSLLDLMIRNAFLYHSVTRVIEIGFSDHFA
jgi:exonuclease III